MLHLWRVNEAGLKTSRDETSSNEQENYQHSPAVHKILQYVMSDSNFAMDTI